MRKDQIHSFTNIGLSIGHPMRYALKIKPPIIRNKKEARVKTSFGLEKRKRSKKKDLIWEVRKRIVNR